MAIYAHDTLEAKSVAVLYDNTNDYSIGLYESFAAKAKELERMAKADGDMPAMDHASLMDVLKRIDNVMEWRFVNALGEVVLDADILAESIDCETLRSMRQCVVNAIVDIEEAEEGRDE